MGDAVQAGARGQRGEAPFFRSDRETSSIPQQARAFTTPRPSGPGAPARRAPLGKAATPDERSAREEARRARLERRHSEEEAELETRLRGFLAVLEHELSREDRDEAHRVRWVLDVVEANGARAGAIAWNDAPTDAELVPLLWPDGDWPKDARGRLDEHAAAEECAVMRRLAVLDLEAATPEERSEVRRARGLLVAATGTMRRCRLRLSATKRARAALRAALRRANALRRCGEGPVLTKGGELVRDPSTGRPVLQVFHCRHRLCPSCERERSRELFEAMRPVVDLVLHSEHEAVTDGRLRFVTLTTPHASTRVVRERDEATGDVTEHIEWMGGWASMLDEDGKPLLDKQDRPRLRFVSYDDAPRAAHLELATRIRDGFKTLRADHPEWFGTCFLAEETTYNADHDEWHVHLHIAAIGTHYIPQPLLEREWCRILGIPREGMTIVDVRAKLSSDDVHEATKYALKGGAPSLMAMPRARAKEIVRSLRGRRLHERYGLLRAPNVARAAVDILVELHAAGGAAPNAWAFDEERAHLIGVLERRGLLRIEVDAQGEELATLTERGEIAARLRLLDALEEEHEDTDERVDTKNPEALVLIPSTNELVPVSACEWSWTDEHRKAARAAHRELALLDAARRAAAEEPDDDPHEATGPP